MIDSQFYVYLYKDIDGTPIYIGKGKKRRAYDHFNGKTHLSYLLQKRKLTGHNIEPVFICKNVDEEFAFFVEVEMISKYGRKDLGLGTLFNRTNGGEGGNFGPAWSDKISKSVKTYFETESNTERLRESIKTKWSDSEYANKVRKGRVETFEAKWIPYTNIVCNSNIDFSKIGWVKLVALLLDIKHQNVKKWMLNYMPEFYDSCYKKTIPNRTNDRKITNVIV